MKNLTRILKQLTPEQIREKLENRGYAISPLGLILIKRGNYEDNLGDIRISEEQVVVSPSKKKLKEYLPRLKMILKGEGISYRNKGKYFPWF